MESLSEDVTHQSTCGSMEVFLYPMSDSGSSKSQFFALSLWTDQANMSIQEKIRLWGHVSIFGILNLWLLFKPLNLKCHWFSLEGFVIYFWTALKKKIYVVRELHWFSVLASFHFYKLRLNQGYWTEIDFIEGNNPLIRSFALNKSLIGALYKCDRGKMFVSAMT